MGLDALLASFGSIQFEAGMGIGGQGNLFILDSSQDGITALGNSQATATPIIAQNNRVTSVAAGTGIRLPAAVRGLDMIVINHGANQMLVYPGGTDAINDNGASNPAAQMVNSCVLYFCMTTGQWYTEGLASGFDSGGGTGSFQTMSYQTGITAHAGGGQGSAVPLTAMNCFIQTVVTAGDSVILPSAAPGMEITVINQSATATGPNVFPATGQSINALAANTAIAVAPQSVLIFFCGIAGAWWTK
jgi:hypothetical protein